MAENGSVIIKILGDDKDFSNKLKSLGNSATNIMKVTAAGAATAASAVAALGAAAVNAYADYEQLVGGVKTLFKESEAAVLEYANNAYISAGMSANKYMETVTSFSASLLQGLGNDTQAAADMGDMAVRDMADNANKMGTSMETIVQTYQSLSRGNYAMLDSLKLGYGGTKAEMERLIATAAKLDSSVKANDMSFANMVKAIHAVQVEMGIAGATEEEAADTIQGSVASMQAAWQNMLVGLGDSTQDFDGLLTKFIDSVGTAAKNILPRVEVVLSGMRQLVAGLVPEITAALPRVTNELLPELTAVGLEAISSLVQGITDNGDALAEGALSIISTLGEGILELLPMMGEMAASLITSLAAGMTENLPNMIPVAVDAIGALVESLTENAGDILQAGISIIAALGEGVVEALPNLIQTVPQIVTNIADTINQNATKLVLTAAGLIVQLGVGLIQAIPVLVTNIPAIIEAIVKAFFAFQWVNLGSTLISAVGNGVKSMGGALRQAGADVSEALAGKIRELPAKLLQIGKDAVAGLAKGIKDAVPNLLKAAGEMSGNLLSNITGFFQIQSPSKVMNEKVGAMLVAGVAQGITQNKSKAVQAAEEMSRELLTAAEQYAEDKKFYNEMTLQEEQEFWEHMKTLKEFTAEDQAKIDKKIYSAKQAILEEEKRLMEEHQAEVEAREKEMQASAERISGFKGLFDSAESEDVSGKDLISNLESQMDAIEKYRDNLEALKEKGVSGSLFEELAGMGPDAADEIEALNKLTAKQLDEYIALYEEKKAVAEEIAQGFFSVGEEAAATLQETSAEGAAEGVEKQENAVTESTKTLVEAAKEEVSAFRTDFVTIGADLMAGLGEGIENGESGVVSAMEKVLRAAVKKAREEMDIHSPSRVMAAIGDFMAQGIGVGWKDRMEEVNASISHSLSDGLESRLTNAYARMKSAMDSGMNRLSGDLAVQAKGTSNYTTNTTTTREGDFIVQIEKIVNEGKGTVAGMMEEFEFIRRQKAMATGGA